MSNSSGRHMDRCFDELAKAQDAAGITVSLAIRIHGVNYEYHDNRRREHLSYDLANAYKGFYDLTQRILREQEERNDKRDKLQDEDTQRQQDELYRHDQEE